MTPTRFSLVLFALAAAAAAGAQGTPLPRGATVGDAKPMPTAKALPSAAAPASWSKSFDLGSGERTGFGFAVGSPGPIVVNARWTGAPLTISLVKPGGTSVDQQGNGSVTIQYSATADDVKRGMIWTVSVRPAQQSAILTRTSTVELIAKPVRLAAAGVSTGTITTQHPAGDINLAQAELKARADRARAAEPRAAVAVAPLFAQQVAALQTQEKSRQTAILDQLKSKVPAQALQRMSARIAAGQKSSSGAAPVTTPATSTSSQAVTAAGSGTPATVALDPNIGSLNVTTGQPGDPVLIAGSNFSSAPGEAHFIIGNGKDVVAPVTAWNDTQILAAVPDASGVQGYNGFVYVSRGTAKSKLVPFRFDPSMEIRTLGATADKLQVNVGSEVYPGCAWHPKDFNLLFGFKGDDQYFLTTTLKNGWTVKSAYLTDGTGHAIFIDGGANAYVSELRQGTDSPYVKVHWWVDAWSLLDYCLHVDIIGPKGVPHF